LEKQNLEYAEDLKYLNILVANSNVLNIKEGKFIDILKNILQQASKHQIMASYVIKKTSGNYITYEIDITGGFPSGKFGDFHRFVKEIEKIRAVKEIQNFKIEKKDNVYFEIKSFFWSLR
jgi:hypothetical protein